MSIQSDFKKVFVKQPVKSDYLWLGHNQMISVKIHSVRIPSFILLRPVGIELRNKYQIYPVKEIGIIILYKFLSQQKCTLLAGLLISMLLSVYQNPDF